MSNQFLFSHLLSLSFFQSLVFNCLVYLIKTGDKYFHVLALYVLFKGCWSYKSNINGWFHCLVIGLVQGYVRSILFMNEMFLSCLPYCSFIQGSSHFPHVRALVHVLALQGLILFNLLIFLVHSLVSLVYIFLMLNSVLWLLQDLLGQDLRLTCFKLILQCLLIGLY